MTMEHNFLEREARDVLLKQTRRPISAPTRVSDNDNSCFECNICLESAHEPVVTLCGHLYCWPCIYKWLHVRTSSMASNEQQQSCPVCKAKISLTSLVPLYGRGTTSSSKSEAKKPNLVSVIPNRPTPVLSTSITNSTLHPTQQLHADFFQSQSQSFHNPQYFPNNYSGYPGMAFSSLGGMATSSVFNPLMGMLGGMSLARIFGSSDTSLLTYPYAHPLMVSNNPRIRRQEVELDKSLNRVSIFLFCCFILCFLLF